MSSHEALDIQAVVVRRLLSSVLRIFVDAVSKWHCTKTASRSVKGAMTGAASLFREQSADKP